MSSPNCSPYAHRSRSSSKKQPRAPLSDFSNTQNNAKLMNCLHIVQNQLKKPQTSELSPTLQDQYLALSKAYDNSQEKILSLEECLMHETLLTQKQRSIIEILKQALDETMDDQTVLSFLGQLSRESPTSSELSETILSIKNILEKHKLGAYLRTSKMQKLEQGLREIEQRYEMLKGEFVRVEEMNRGYAREVERVGIKARQDMDRARRDWEDQLIQRDTKQKEKEQKYVEKVKQLEAQVQSQKQLTRRKCQQLQLVQQQYTKLQQQHSTLLSQHQCLVSTSQSQNSNLQQQLKSLTLSEQSLRSKYICELNQRQRLTHQLSLLNQTVQSLRGSPVTPSPPLSLVTYSSNLQNDVVSLVVEKDREIQRLGKRVERLERKVREGRKQEANAVMKTEVFIMKKFMTEEAVKLLGDYQQNPKEYLEKEIVQLAKLQNQKRQYLQNCQRQLRRYKIKLLQYQQAQSQQNHPPSTTQRSKSRTLQRTGKFSCSQFNIN